MGRRICALALLLGLLLGGVPARAQTPPSLRYDQAAPEGSGLGRLRGLLALPAGKSQALVILLHGRHISDAKDCRPYYQGLDYLAQALAAQGFAALAPDLNGLYAMDEDDEIAQAIALVDAHLALLARGGAGFPPDTAARLSPDRLCFVGHSRGGGLAPLLANYYALKGKVVLGNVLIAPTSYIGVVSEDGQTVLGTSPYVLTQPRMDLPLAALQPTAVLMGQYDGDVDDQPGYCFYLNAIQQARPPVPLLSAYLYGADHAAFNTELGQQADPKTYEGATLAPREQVRDFARRFVVEALRLCLPGGEGLARLWQPGALKDYPLPCALTVYAPQARRLLPPFTEKLEGLSLTGGMKATWVKSSALPEQAKDAGAFVVPGFDGSLSSHATLCRLQWDKAGEAAWFTLTGPTAGRQLLLTWANDPTRDPKSLAQPLALSLIAEDGAGKQARISLSSEDTISLKPQAGQAELDPVGHPRWSRPLPLLSQVVDLSAFTGIDTSSLRRLGIQGDSPSGAMMVYDISILP